MAFLKIAWTEPIAEMRAKYFAARMKVVMQLRVYCLKPMTADKRATGLTGEKHEKARICLQGQNHEGFQMQNSATNADAGFDVSNAFLNAELLDDAVILTQPSP